MGVSSRCLPCHQPNHHIYLRHPRPATRQARRCQQTCLSSRNQILLTIVFSPPVSPFRTLVPTTFILQLLETHCHFRPPINTPQPPRSEIGNITSQSRKKSATPRFVSVAERAVLVRCNNVSSTPPLRRAGIASQSDATRESTPGGERRQEAKKRHADA